MAVSRDSIVSGSCRRKLLLKQNSNCPVEKIYGSIQLLNLFVRVFHCSLANIPSQLYLTQAYLQVLSTLKHDYVIIMCSVDSSGKDSLVIPQKLSSRRKLVHA
jgi:hypothetical protein